MTIFYVNPAAGSGGTGTEANPFNNFSSITTVAGDSVLIRTNTTFNGGIPDAIFAPGNVTVGYYGTGARPIIFGGQTVTMTASASPGIFQWSAGSNICGNASINDVMCRWVEWNTSLAITAPTMTDDSMTFDYVNFILYVKPAGGTLAGKTVVASVVVNGARDDDGGTLNFIDGIDFRRMSRHGAVMANAHGVHYRDCIARECGGWRDIAGNFWVGNGFEIGGTSIDAVIERCESYSVFDSGFTSQLYAAQTGVQAARNHTYVDCKVVGCGYSGYEFAALDTFQRLEGMYVIRPYARDCGVDAHWSQNRGNKGHAISMIAGHTGLGALDRVLVESPDFARQKYGVRNSFSNGVMRINGGTITGSETNAILTEQLGSPSYARTIVAISSRTNITGTDANGGYSDSIVRF